MITLSIGGTFLLQRNKFKSKTQSHEEAAWQKSSPLAGASTSSAHSPPSWELPIRKKTQTHCLQIQAGSRRLSLGVICQAEQTLNANSSAPSLRGGPGQGCGVQKRGEGARPSASSLSCTDKGNFWPPCFT